MTYATALVPQTGGSTDAQLRDWGSAISGLLTSAGAAQTADTGQVNWTTVTRPGSSQTLIGYEIRTVGTNYLRIEWKTGGGTLALYMSVTVGTGSDGAGTLTGTFGIPIYSNQAQANSTAATTTTTLPGYACTMGNSLALFLGAGYVGTQAYLRQHVVVISQKTDASLVGTASWLFGWNTTQADGVISWTDVGTSPYSWSYNWGYSYTGINPNHAYPYYVTQASTSVGGVVPVTLLEHLTPDVGYHPMFVFVNTADAAEGTSISASVLGATRSYVSMGNYAAYLDDFDSASPPRVSIAILGE